MTEGPTLIGTILTGGLGAALGSVITAVIQLMGHKGESRATAADLVTHAASALSEQQANTIARLEQRDERLRQAALLLTDTLDELLPQLQLPDGELVRLRKAVSSVKLAV